MCRSAFTSTGSSVPFREQSSGRLAGPAQASSALPLVFMHQPGIRPPCGESYAARI
jgi:hypothetical protein